MKETAILMDARMVRATMHPTRPKRVTRRLVTPQPPPGCGINYSLGNESWLPEDERTPLRHSWEAWHGDLFTNRPKGHLCGHHTVKCPYGRPGDRLLLLSSWATEPRFDGIRPKELPSAARIWTRWQNADESAEKPAWCGKLRPGRFMPLALRAGMPRAEIVSVDVQRLHAMPFEDLALEGIAALHEEIADEAASIGAPGETTIPTYQELFVSLWDSINYSRGAGYQLNPVVWRIEYNPIDLAGAIAA
jgi:hypothetical protein